MSLGGSRESMALGEKSIEHPAHLGRIVGPVCHCSRGLLEEVAHLVCPGDASPRSSLELKA